MTHPFHTPPPAAAAQHEQPFTRDPGRWEKERSRALLTGHIRGYACSAACERRARALDFGRPPEHDLRDIMDAILYVDRTGVQWRYLPHDFPHWNTVWGYFVRWQQEGVFAQLNGLLRQLLRRKEGREDEPSACVIDAQSLKTSVSVLASGQGIDAGKRIEGRKRSIATDTMGLLLTVLLTEASVQDSIAGSQLLDQVAAEHPRIRKVWVDGGYRRHLVEHAAGLGIDMEITQRKPGTRGFTRSRSGGWSSGPTTGSCATAAWPATTKPGPPAPKP